MIDQKEKNQKSILYHLFPLYKHKLIDDISVIQAQVMKSTFNKNLEIKSILDKDQALMFDKLLQRKQRMTKQKKMPLRNKRN